MCIRDRCQSDRLILPLGERRSLSVVGRRRSLGIPLSERCSLPGPAPAGGPISCTDKKWGKEAAGVCAPLTPSAASGWPSAKVGGAPSTDKRTGVQHPASRRAAGAMPLPESLRDRTGSAFGEARPLLRGAQRPQGGGKLRGFAAHARRARERPERALFSAVRPLRAIRCALLGAPAT